MTRFAPEASSAPRTAAPSVTSPCTKVTRARSAGIDDRLEAAAVAALIEHDRLVATLDERLDHPRADTAERAGHEIRGGHRIPDSIAGDFGSSRPDLVLVVAGLQPCCARVSRPEGLLHMGTLTFLGAARWVNRRPRTGDAGFPAMIAQTLRVLPRLSWSCC